MARIKKEQGESPAQKLSRSIYVPEKIDVILIDGVALPMRAKTPPETWTSRLEPLGRPELALLDYLFILSSFSAMIVQNSDS